MQSFSFDVPYAVARDEVFAAFWNLESWPEVARHVTDIEMHYDEAGVQILTMHVETKGRRDRFRSVRIRQGDSIFFFQPEPPPALRRHYGWWHVRPTGEGGSVVTSEHSVDIDTGHARGFLADTGQQVTSDDEVVERLSELIRNNSRQTMEALRHRLENPSSQPEEATR